MIPPVFLGQSVAIVAGGPSLAGVDWRPFDGLNTIAINRAHEVLPEAQVLWWSDAMYYRRAKDSLLAHRAPHKATCQLLYNPGECPSEITEYRFTGVDGFDPDPRCLRHGNNSAFAAMHLAAHLGAAQVVLFGVDMRHGGSGLTHWHGGHGFVHRDEMLSDLMLPHFASLVRPLADRGVAVLNASPDSRLALWPKCSIEEGIAHVQARTTRGSAPGAHSGGPRPCRAYCGP